MIQTVKKEILSSDGIHTLCGIVLVPEHPKGIFQIAHGMIEHIGRYEALMTYLAENGFIVCGHDHLGHGPTEALAISPKKTATVSFVRTFICSETP